MANPNADYPAAIHEPIDVPALSDTPLGDSDPKHSEIHGKLEQEVVAIQEKLGTGDSDLTIGYVLTVMPDGSTAWQPSAGGGGGGSWGTINGAISDQTDLQAALDAKQPLNGQLTSLGALTTTAFGRALLELANAAALASAAGLGNVNNTSDVNKPVSSAQQAALDLKADLVAGKVPSAQLPSFVDDVIEAANFAALPGTGETGKIYVTLDDNKEYRWSGTVYVEISASLALGETSSTAYRGDRGKTAYDHSQLTSGNPHNVSKSDVGLSSVDNTADAAKVVASAAILTNSRTIDGQSFNGSANITVIAPGTHAATSKATPVDADEIPLVDSAASNVLKRLTWANLKATLKTYFDGIYQSALGYAAENVANKDTDTSLASNSDTKYASQKAIKSYVDGLAQGLSIKQSCRVATAAALPTNTYLTGVITETGNGALTVDSVVVNNGDRVLVKDEASGLKNGIYVVTDKGSAGTPFILTRSTDMDSASEVPGAFSFIEEGTINSGSGYVVASGGPFTIGTTGITWTQFSSPAGVYNPRIQTAADATSITPDFANYEIVKQTNTQTLGTLTINNPAVAPAAGKEIIVRIKSTNAHALAVGGKYRASIDLAVPPNLSGGGLTDYFKFKRHGDDDKYDFVGAIMGF